MLAILCQESEHQFIKKEELDAALKRKYKLDLPNPNGYLPNFPNPPGKQSKKMGLGHECLVE